MNGWRKNDASPEVERSQAEADSRVWNLNGSIHHLHLALLHRARQPRLPADHKLTRGFVGTAGRATIGTLALKAALNFNHFFSHQLFQKFAKIQKKRFRKCRRDFNNTGNDRLLHSPPSKCPR